VEINLSFNISFIANYLGTANFKNDYILKKKPLAVTTY
jgi:hypothetical protein